MWFTSWLKETFLILLFLVKWQPLIKIVIFPNFPWINTCMQCGAVAQLRTLACGGSAPKIYEGLFMNCKVYRATPKESFLVESFFKSYSAAILKYNIKSVPSR